MVTVKTTVKSTKYFVNMNNKCVRLMFNLTGH